MDKNFVLLKFYGTSQKDIKTAKNNYTYFRSYFSNKSNSNVHWTYVIYSAMVDILALAANKTLLTPDHPEFSDDGRYPTLIPIVKLFDRSNLTVGHMWNEFRNKPSPHSKAANELPVFFRMDDISWNFVYCAIPKRKLLSIWNFSLFTNPFDFWTWGTLFSALIIVSYLAYFWKHTFPLVFPILSALITPGISGIPKMWGHSGLLLLWTFASTVICIFYTGQIASQVISPSPEDILSNLIELNQQGYFIIGEGSKGWISELNSTPYKLTGMVSVLQKIYERTGGVIHLNRTAFSEKLATENKFAGLRVWPYAIGTAIEINDKFLFGGLKGKGESRKCYVGKELIPTGEVHFAIVPPDTKKLSQAFKNVQASGIWVRWVQESILVVSTPRVQNRVKILSTTKILNNDDLTIESLTMEGKTITIFLLWVVSIICSSLSFLFEYILFIQGVSKVSSAILPYTN